MEKSNDYFSEEGYRTWLTDEFNVSSESLSALTLQLQSDGASAPENETIEDVPKQVIETEKIIRDVFHHIEEFYRKDRLKPKYKKLVIVVGNSGAGKSTLIGYLAAADLMAKTKHGKSIIDSNPPSDVEIGHDLESKTFFPQFRDIAGTVYCDMPGFENTRGIVEEISTAIFMKKVADHAEQVKILVTIAHSDLYGRAAELRNLLKYLSAFIHDINELNDGIALVVTKVENSTRVKKGNDVPKTDEEIIQEILDTLNRFIENNGPSFLSSIIDRQRVKIFRQPPEEGKLTDLELPGLGKPFETECSPILNMVKSTSYLGQAQLDFGYSVTSDAQLDSIAMAKNLKAKIAALMDDIFIAIKNHYSNKIEHSIDIYDLKEQFDRQDWSKTQFDLSDPDQFLDGVRQNVNAFRIGISQRQFKQLLATNEFLLFFKSLSKEVEGFSDYSGLDTFLDFWNQQKEFNQTLDQLIDIKLDEKITIDLLDKVRNGGDKTLLPGLGGSNYANFTQSQKNEIDQLLASLLTPPKFERGKSEHDKDTVLVLGCIVKLSEVLDSQDLTRGDNKKSLHIFASKAFIMDRDLERHGKNVSILAPEWYIFGSNKITLDGSGGKPHTSQKAADGKIFGQQGEDGAPGEPGGSAGNFLGIAHTFIFHDSSALTIHANGGNGGPGQDGGDGHSGRKGIDAKDPKEDEKNRKFLRRWEESDLIRTVHYCEFKLLGSDGEKGGDAGKGGQGGQGGHAGNIEIIGHSCSDIKTLSKLGKRGQDGKHGKVGSGGKGGKNKLQTHASQISCYPDEDYTTKCINTEWWSLPTLEDGKSGHQGTLFETPNTIGIKQSEPCNMIWYQPLIQYKEHMLKNLRNKFLKRKTEDFLDVLNEIQGKF